MGDVVRLVSGGFDPIHSGHVSLLDGASRKFEDHLDTIVALNSDEWLIRKKGNFLLPWHERASVLMKMKGVGMVIAFDDADDTTCDAIRQLRKRWPEHEINFHNGGDRSTPESVLEVLRFSDDPKVKFHYATGGNTKLNSSSDILHEYMQRQQQQTQRDWGEYNVLKEFPNSKLKTLTVLPGRNLSMQQHKYRGEHWFVAEGTATLDYQAEIAAELTQVTVQKNEFITIPRLCWHRLRNETSDLLQIVEIQFGPNCYEDDILRLDLDK